MNYAENRKIKQDRVYKTLGKVTWWRIVLGIGLIVYIFLLSGTVSDLMASQGHFKTARALMVAPGWMEKNRPEDRLYIEAGALHQEGRLEEAYTLSNKVKNTGEKYANLYAQAALDYAQALMQQGRNAEAEQVLEGLSAPYLSAERLQQYQHLTGAEN